MKTMILTALIKILGIAATGAKERLVLELVRYLNKDEKSLVNEETVKAAEELLVNRLPFKKTR